MDSEDIIERLEIEWQCIEEALQKNNIDSVDTVKGNINLLLLLQCYQDIHVNKEKLAALAKTLRYLHNKNLATLDTMDYISTDDESEELISVKTFNNVACCSKYAVYIDDNQAVINDTPNRHIKGEFTAVSASANYVIFLHKNGSIVSLCGDSNEYTHIANNSYYVSIACGACHFTALKADGSLDTLMIDSVKKSVPPGNDFIKVASGAYHSVALRSNGTVVTWGDNSWKQYTDSPVDGNHKDIACGDWHSLALKNDGSVVSWGSNRDGQRNHTPTHKDFIAIACGSIHSAALRINGTVLIWYDDQVKHMFNSFIRVYASYNSVAAINRHGVVTVCNIVKNSIDRHTSEKSRYVKVACGTEFCMALDANGQVDIVK